MTGHKKTVVITGTSTGIGKTCALTLAAQGWRVFAGVRKAADGQALLSDAVGTLTPLLLDITDRESIEAAVTRVGQEIGAPGLDGLVNNAGIAIGGPLEFIPISEISRQLETNVVGQIAATQAFLPMLRQSCGRVVLMGSVSGLSSLPFFGPYCASKFALEALADALRLELRPWDVQVSIIEPGATKTPIWEKSVIENHALVADFPPHAGFLYGDMLHRLDEVIDSTSKRAVHPAKVADAVVHALTSRRPKARYLIGGMGRVQLVLEALPVRLRDFILAQVFLGQRSQASVAKFSADRTSA